MSLANNHDCLMLADEENGINGDRAKRNAVRYERDVRVSHS